ncbi:MAG: malate/lactate/ureidoglycolate dehydrogenase [Alphaproteobacteria bacterium]|nr:malate/lactate/ureidoglycolate dehydrogenase [Alphaproteobacteria bacterium]
MPQVTAERLAELIKTMCRRSGSAEREAQLVADHLVAANLSGHDSHGVGMMPAYIAAVREDRLRPNTVATVALDSGPFLVVDGNGGYGQVVAHEAIERAIAKARVEGLCLMALRNAHHIGRIGHWGELCAAAGFISIHYVNAISHRAVVAPHGGADARFVTNPYCTAIPAMDGEPPVILDFATSLIAMGKVRVAHNKGEAVPEGALIDADGRPTRDPGVMFAEPRGALRSMGQQKGYGLALVCDILAGALSGGGTFLPERLARNTIINNMLAIVLDPARFGEIGAIGAEMAAFQHWVRASPPAPGVERVMLPGEPERRSRAERLARGVPVDARTWEELVATAAGIGIGRAEFERIAGHGGSGAAHA